MSGTSSTSYKPQIAVGGKSPSITNLAMAVANTEYAHTLKDNLHQLTIRSRVPSTVKLAFVSTESGTKYITMKPCTVFNIDGIDFSGKILYVQSDTASNTLEIFEIYT